MALNAVVEGITASPEFRLSVSPRFPVALAPIDPVLMVIGPSVLPSEPLAVCAYPSTFDPLALTSCPLEFS